MWTGRGARRRNARRRGQGVDPDYASWNGPSWTNPPLDRATIEAERERLPERVSKQEYGGEFIEGSGSVFRYVREAAMGEFCEPQPDETYCAGLDLARVEDFSVLVITDATGRVAHFDRFHRLDWSLQIARVKAATERYRARTYVDTTGAGEPVYEALRCEGVRVEAYPFTTKSKSALIDSLALRFERRELTLPRPEL